ncbi:MAG: succinate dehydrogenase, cytochrome b556 subunit [Candidatus Methanofastidiosia archaeon]
MSEMNFKTFKEGRVEILKKALLGAREVGMLAFILHRITGVILVFYLFLHIWVMASGLEGAESFDRVLSRFQTPFWVVADLFLLAAVLFHGLNGLRLTLFDLGVGIKSQKLIFYIIFGLSVLGFLVAVIFSLPLIVG